MLVLAAGERILLEKKECRLTIKYKILKATAGFKGTLYITNVRIAFEDRKQGIVLQIYPSQYELQAYRVVKGLLGGTKLAMDFQRERTIGIAEVEFKEKKEVEEAVEALQTLTNSSSNVRSASPIPIPSPSNTSPSPNNYTMNTMTNMSSVEVEGRRMSWEEYEKQVHVLFDRFARGERQPYEDLVLDHEDFLKPYALKWINDIDFSKWSYIEEKENEFIAFRGDLGRIYYSYVQKGWIDPSKHTKYFLDKIAKEALKLKATIPYHADKHGYPDPRINTNKYWVGEIEGELIGINVNHGWTWSYILNPTHFVEATSAILTGWYHWDTGTKNSEYPKYADLAEKYWKALMQFDTVTAREAAKEFLTFYKEDSPHRVAKIGEFELSCLYAEEMKKRNIPIPKYKPAYIK